MEMEEAANIHRPVLVAETLAHLAPERGGRFVDGTVGCGGHAAAILAACPAVELLGIDCDEAALSVARRTLAPFGDRVELRHGSYTELAELAGEKGWDAAAGIVFDVGLSSLQIDRAERGFSYVNDGPLDMRMNLDEPLTAATILNTAGAEELTFILRLYGELPRPARLARAIIQRRRERPWERTAELAALVRRVVGRVPGRRVAPEALCFQALRIAVNNELENFDTALESAIAFLAPGGRLAAISFHSLEDRLVKRTFREAAAECVCPPGLPVCCCGKRATVRVLTRRPVRATKTETAANPRAAPARLRACEKLPEPGAGT